MLGKHVETYQARLGRPRTLPTAGAGGADKRCMMEARPAGQQPVAVTNHGSTVDEAVSGALRKLGSLLESRFGRLDLRKGGATVRRAEGS